MSNEIEIVVRVTDRTGAGFGAARRGARDVEREAGGSLGKFAEKAKMVGLVAGAALVKLGSDAINAASDAQQSLGGTQAVFGKYADQIINKSKGAATAVGLSANQYRESANLIGSLFKNQGVAADKLAGSTEKVVKMGADLAATYGGTAADAVEALTAAYKGEFDPIEKYGISLKASTVSQKAWTIAGVDSLSAFQKLTPAQQAAAKQQATTALLTKQSADAQGQFALQTDTVAEKLQIVKAKYTDLSAQIGAKLLPVVAKLLDKGVQLIAWLQKNPAVIYAVVAAVGVLAAAFIALGIAMAANPVGLVIAGLMALAAAFAYCWAKSQTFRTVVISVFKAVSNAELTLASVMLRGFRIIIEGWLDVAGAIVNGAAKAFSWIPGVGGKLKSAASAFNTFKEKSLASLNAAANAADRLRAKINNIPTHKSVNISVTTHYGHTGSAPNGRDGNVPIGQAHGGYAGVGAASGGPRAGLTMVGEYGRELVNFTSGRVYNHGETERIMKNQSNGGVVAVQIQWVGGNGGDDFMRWLRRNIRVTGGGNVQKALGYGS